MGVGHGQIWSDVLGDSFPRGERFLDRGAQALSDQSLTWLGKLIILLIAHLLRWHNLNYKALLMYIGSFLDESGLVKKISKSS